MASSGSVMQKEGIETIWIDVPITVTPKGTCSVDLEVSSAFSPGVCNTRENTKVAYPDTVLHGSPAALDNLVTVENRVNAKHFVVTKYAKNYLEFLNAENTSYTDGLVKKTNLYCVDLKDKSKTFSSSYEIDIVNSSDSKQCVEASSFQQDNLEWFRRLSGEENIKKMKERYSLDAFNSRVVSPEIIVFVFKKSDDIQATFTLNLHTTSNAQESTRFGYLSDLFVAKGLEDNDKFISQFIESVFAKIVSCYPRLEVLSVMAASGNPEIPIVKCFEHARKAGLIHLFSRSEQERLGVVAQFTLDPKNAGNTHSSSESLTPLRTLSVFSVLANTQSRVDAQQHLEPKVSVLR